MVELSSRDQLHIVNANPTLETPEVSLDIGIAFEKLWHPGLICELRSRRVQGSLLILLNTFLWLIGINIF